MTQVEIELMIAKNKQLEADIIDVRDRLGRCLRESKLYNGHANYETWAMSMHLDGNYDGEGTYHHFQELAQEHYDSAEATSYASRDDNARRGLADALKEAMDDGCNLIGQCSVYSDLMSAALSEVNWYDLAENLLENVEKEEESSDEE
jgi:hypothetical protein